MITCSQCGIPKREVNHWWFAWVERGGERFCVVPWESDPGLMYEATVQKLCGQGCVLKANSQWMENVSGK